MGFLNCALSPLCFLLGSLLFILSPLLSLSLTLLSLLVSLLFKTSSFLRLLLKQMVPYQTLTPIRQYLSLARRSVLSRDTALHRRLLSLTLCLSFYLLDLMYLWVTSATPLERHRHADFIYLTTRLDSLYPCIGALYTMLLYFLHLLFTVKPPFLGLLEGMLFTDGHPFLAGLYSPRFRSPLQMSRLIALGILNTIRPLVLLADYLVLSVGYDLLVLALQQPLTLLGDPQAAPLLFACRLARLSLAYLAFVTVLLLYSTVAINIASLSCTGLLLLYLRHRHAETLLPVSPWPPGGQHCFPGPSVARYLAYRTATFRYLFIANETAGYVLVAFLTVNMPVSAFSLVHLALGVPTLRAAISLSLFLGHGLLCCLLIHWFIARATKLMGTPVMRLFRLMAATSGGWRHRRVGTVRARLATSLAIGRFSGKYGITYGTFGCVTMGSFAKCMLLFAELVLYSYKLILGI